MSLTEEQVRADVAELLGELPSDIADQDNLADRGMDSIRMMTLVRRWQDAGVEIGFLELMENPTVADWWRLLSSQRRDV